MSGKGRAKRRTQVCLTPSPELSALPRASPLVTPALMTPRSSSELTEIPTLTGNLLL